MYSISSYFNKITLLIKKNGRSSKALKQVFYSFTLQTINIIIGILYVPLLLNYLTQEKYGIWLTLTSILGWFSFFDIGLGNGLRNKLTEALAKKDYVLGQKYVSTTYAILFGIFSIILFLFHLSNFFLNWNSILNTQSIDNHELYILTSIVFSFFLIRFIVQLISVVFLADQKPSINNLVTTSGNLLSLLLVILLIHSSIKGNLIFLGSIISAIPVFLFILTTIIAFKGRYKLIKPKITKIDFKLSHALINLGAKFFFLQISAMVIYSTSSIFIAQFYGSKEVVAYNIAFKYFQMPVMIFSIILSPIWSAVTDAHAKSDFNWLKKTLKLLNAVSFFFAICIIGMVSISSWVYKVWIGSEISIPFSLSMSLAIYAIMQVSFAPYSNYINGFGKIKLTMSFTILEIGIYLILIYIFGRIFSNSTGIVMAIIFTSVIGAIIQPWQTYKILNGKAKGIWNK